MTPTRDQVRAAVEAYGSQLDIVPTLDGITDAVMDVLCDAELDAEGELREQLTARYEQRLAQAQAEAPQPKVLWKGRTMQATHRNMTNTGDVPIEGYSVLTARFNVPHQTAVVVVEDTAPPDTEDPPGGTQ
ncbi:MAG TPA: hypothetical protein VK611_24895 [Acidimicrobiales bacterium]|nr:hypothetical protein [Acidimicrobiales bacterium]